MIISDQLWLSFLEFCSYRLIGISIKSHIGTAQTYILSLYASIYYSCHMLKIT